MADVRLTATNPEDSSVVPVACNEKGELKLEEPLVVEGPKGDKGDKGDSGEDGAPGQDGDPFSGNFADDVSFDGKATFKGGALIGMGNASLSSCIRRADHGQIVFYASAWLVSGSPVPLAIYNNPGNVDSVKPVAYIFADGSATFSDGKAGFTADGHLWCTPTSDLNNQRYVLERVSQGIAMWSEYQPSLDRNDWSKKNAFRPKPEDSSQDEPETKQ